MEDLTFDSKLNNGVLFTDIEEVFHLLDVGSPLLLPCFSDLSKVDSLPYSDLVVLENLSLEFICAVLVVQ